MNRTHLSIVIPAYNEEARLESSLRRIASFMAQKEWEFEIVVVDDGSTDRTAEIASNFERDNSGIDTRVLSNEENRGKGHSVRRGMLASRGKYALLSDADLSTPIAEFEKLEKRAVSDRLDLAFGSRDVAGSRVLLHQSWIRENSGKMFNRLVRILTPLPFRDTQCGFKLFKMRTCRGIFKIQKIDRYAFDVEILVIANLWGLKMAEVPVNWSHSEGSKVNLLPDGPMMLLDLLKVRLNQLSGRYSRRSF